MAKDESSPVGDIADVDDIAPQGQRITQADVDAHDKDMRRAHKGLPDPKRK